MKQKYLLILSFFLVKDVGSTYRKVVQETGQRNVRQFLQSAARFGLPWVRSWDNRGKCYMDVKEDSMLVKRIAAYPIYLQPFASYSEILVGNCYFYLPLAFNAPVGVFQLEFREKFGPQKTRIMGLPNSLQYCYITLSGWCQKWPYADAQYMRRPFIVTRCDSLESR